MSCYQQIGNGSFRLAFIELRSQKFIFSQPGGSTSFARKQRDGKAKGILKDSWAKLINFSGLHPAPALRNIFFEGDIDVLAK